MSNLFCHVSTEHISKCALKSQKMRTFLKITAIVCYVFFLCMQLFMAARVTSVPINDGKIYYNFARECALRKTWYPNTVQIFSPYFSGIGLVNLMILVLRLFNNVRIIYLVNILLCQVILFSCAGILKQTFKGSAAPQIFVILFSLFATFWAEPENLEMDLLFTACTFLGLYLLYTRIQTRFIFAGIMLALANWVRPMAAAFLIAAVLIALSQKLCAVNIISLIASFFVVVNILAAVVCSNCGYYIKGNASTVGVNLLMAANDDADGSFNDTVFEKGNIGYLSDSQRQVMIFKEYDKFYKDQAFKWIKKHPLKYISLMPKKLFYTYATETYSCSPFYNNKVNTSSLDYLISVTDKITGKNSAKILYCDILIIGLQLYYMLLLALSIISSIRLFAKGYGKVILPYLVAVLLGTMTTLLFIGGARYHFTYLPIMMMLCAIYINYIFTARKR